MSQLPWFKCFPGKLLGALAKLRMDDGYLYAVILLRIYENGGPIRDTAGELARLIGMSIARVDRALVSLAKLGKISVFENGLIDSDTTHRHLEDRRSVSESARKAGNLSVQSKREKSLKNQSSISTTVERTVNHKEEDRDIDKEVESKKEDTSLRSVSKKPETRPHPMPQNWKPGEADWQMAIEAIGERGTRFELEKFHDYWPNVAGAKGKKLDWGATWRRWIRQAVENQQKNARAGPLNNHRPPSAKTTMLHEVLGIPHDQPAFGNGFLDLKVVNPDTRR